MMGEGLKFVNCPQCGKRFRLVWNDCEDARADDEKGQLRPNLYRCAAYGKTHSRSSRRRSPYHYDVRICCPHCDYEEVHEALYRSTAEGRYEALAASGGYYNYSEWADPAIRGPSLRLDRAFRERDDLCGFVRGYYTGYSRMNGLPYLHSDPEEDGCATGRPE